MNSERIRHLNRYQVEHKDLPHLFYQYGVGMLNTLLESKGALVYDLYKAYFDNAGVELPYKQEQINVMSVRMDVDLICVIIVFPEPEEEPLCYTAMLFFDLAQNKGRYYTFEKGNEYDSFFLCSWGEDETHYNHGPCEGRVQSVLNKAKEDFRNKYPMNSIIRKPLTKGILSSLNSLELMVRDEMERKTRYSGTAEICLKMAEDPYQKVCKREKLIQASEYDPFWYPPNSYSFQLCVIMFNLSCALEDAERLEYVNLLDPEELSNYISQKAFLKLGDDLAIDFSTESIEQIEKDIDSQFYETLLRINEIKKMNEEDTHPVE